MSIKVIISLLGPNCDEPLTAGNIQQKEESGIGNVVAGVFAAIMVIAISLAAWFYHRRRVADLKKEMVQVQYIAEPVTPPGIIRVYFLKTTLKHIEQISILVIKKKYLLYRKKIESVKNLFFQQLLM